MAKRPQISKSIRFEVFKRDKFTCQYCGKKAPETILHIDHINPVANDGDNNLMNLVTSCEACNLGKSDRTLNDNSIIEKQRQQLEALEEHRAQLQMLLDWRKGLENLEEEKAQILCEEIGKKGTMVPNENGMAVIKKWLKKHTAQDLLDAIDVSFDQYIVEDENGVTSESWNKAFDMVPRIINAKSLFDEKPYMKDLFYIRGILRRRLSYINERDLMPLLERAYHANVNIEGLKQFAKSVSSWTRFRDAMYDYLEKHEGQNEGGETRASEQDNSEEGGEMKTSVDLNDPNDFTRANLAKLLASKEDNANRQLRVNKAGLAYISDEVGSENISELAFRLETWDAGNGYCGLEAARDELWVESLYNALKANWPNPTSDYIDVF